MGRGNWGLKTPIKGVIIAQSVRLDAAVDDQLATTLLDELQDLGVKPAQLVKRSGLHYSELKQTENIAVLADVALELAGDIGLGLRYGRRLKERAIRHLRFAASRSLP